MYLQQKTNRPTYKWHQWRVQHLTFYLSEHALICRVDLPVTYQEVVVLRWGLTEHGEVVSQSTLMILRYDDHYHIVVLLATLTTLYHFAPWHDLHCIPHPITAWGCLCSSSWFPQSERVGGGKTDKDIQAEWALSKVRQRNYSDYITSLWVIL
jgi:hypothetical protein